MIGILPLIILVVRLRKFLRLTKTDLPLLSDSEIASMKAASKMALGVFFVVTLASFAPYAMLHRLTNDQATILSFGVTIIGLFIAAANDLKAERIKRRGKMVGEEPTARPGDIRWYHYVFVIVLPYIAFFWGIINLIMGKNRSGLLLFVGSIVWYALTMGVILFFATPRS